MPYAYQKHNVWLYRICAVKSLFELPQCCVVRSDLNPVIEKQWLPPMLSLCDLVVDLLISWVDDSLTQLKIANVVPIYKMGNELVFSNYRPVSVLPGFMKLMERLVFSRQINFITNNKLWYKYQFGFQKVTNLVCTLYKTLVWNGLEIIWQTGHSVWYTILKEMNCTRNGSLANCIQSGQKSLFTVTLALFFISSYMEQTCEIPYQMKLKCSCQTCELFPSSLWLCLLMNNALACFHIDLIHLFHMTFKPMWETSESIKRLTMLKCTPPGNTLVVVDYTAQWRDNCISCANSPQNGGPKWVSVYPMLYDMVASIPEWNSFDLTLIFLPTS